MINTNETFVNQDNREIIIKRLDESKENVELEDLFLFDLSPYYAEKLNNSFFSKQLEFIYEKNQLKHNSNISFTSEQLRIYSDIVKNERSIISAPTSFGKTMLVKEYIYNYLPDKVVFIVPTNSLADELLDDFKSLFEHQGYVVFDSTKMLHSIFDKSIFVGTQEKYYNLKENYKEKIDLFVIDEAYKLTDPIRGSREVILNRSFIDTLENSVKMLLLMPLVNSIYGLENFKFKILKSDFAPVAKNFKNEKNLDQVIKNAILKNDSTNLIYFNSPKELEKNFLEEFSLIKNPVNVNSHWIERVEEDFHPEWLPIQSLKSGIGIHYGPMPKFIQKKVIELFKTSKVRNVLATNSIIEGVNTPTKNIYIYSTRDILGDKNLVKFKNLIGRAGRLGQHKVGNIFYWDKHQSQFEKANISYKEINIQFVLENKAEIIEINREENFNNTINEYPEMNGSSLKSYLEKSNYSEVPQKEVVSLLDKHGFTIKKLKILLEYVNSKDVKLIGILGKFFGEQDIEFYNIVLNSKYKKFSEMVEVFHPIRLTSLARKKNNKATIKPHEIHKSVTISIVMDMIYSKFPFDIIPLFNFIIDINNLYNVHTGKKLVPDVVIIDAKRKKAQFYSKFMGLSEPSHESLVVVNKLFEYGIPYLRIKPFLDKITDQLPNKFSIHDIKYVIFNNRSMIPLRVYFE